MLVECSKSFPLATTYRTSQVDLISKPILRILEGASSIFFEKDINLLDISPPNTTNLDRAKRSMMITGEYEVRGRRSKLRMGQHAATLRSERRSGSHGDNTKVENGKENKQAISGYFAVTTMTFFRSKPARKLVPSGAWYQPQTRFRSTATTGTAVYVQSANSICTYYFPSGLASG